MTNRPDPVFYQCGIRSAPPRQTAPSECVRCDL